MKETRNGRPGSFSRCVCWNTSGFSLVLSVIKQAVSRFFKHLFFSIKVGGELPGCGGGVSAALHFSPLFQREIL